MYKKLRNAHKKEPHILGKNVQVLLSSSSNECFALNQ